MKPRHDPIALRKKIRPLKRRELRALQVFVDLRKAVEVVSIRAALSDECTRDFQPPEALERLKAMAAGDHKLLLATAAQHVE